MNDSLYQVDWTQLPQPKDDGAANHIHETTLPSVSLSSSSGGKIDLSQLTGRTVVYIYPMTGTPGVSLPTGWDAIPGARGCTPQSCAFRDHFEELRNLGVDHLYGLSAQPTSVQKEVAERLHLPFSLLSDIDLQFASALKLPTFFVGGIQLLKRMTLVIDQGRVNKLFYPVFPPDRSATDVIDWLRGQIPDGL